jgi:DNA-binding transcriptional MerR regulator
MLSSKTMAKKEKQETIPELLTLKETCEILKCHPNTLRKWDKKGILIAIRIGEKRIMRYRKKDIINFIKK